MPIWNNDFRCSTIAVDSSGGAGGELFIRSISRSNVRPNSEISKEVESQSIYPDTVVLNAVKPMASFTTYDLPGAIAALGLFGKCLTGGTADDYGIKLFGQKQSCSGVAGGSVHDVYTIANGVVVPTSLTVDHRGSGQISYDIYARSPDGTNAPFTYLENQALPTLPATNVGRWTMHAFTLASTVLLGKRNISINFNPTVTQEGADSDIYDGVVSVESIQPVVSVRGVNPKWFAASPLNTLLGVAGTHANSSIVLRRRDVGLGAANHVRMTFAGLATWETVFDGSSNGPAETAINVDLKWDGTNVPIVATTNYIIT